MRETHKFGLLIGIIVIAIVVAAGCSGPSSQITPVPTSPPLDKYVSGDIIAKTAGGTDQEFYLILAYDSGRDDYSRALVYRNTDGSWHRNNVANNTLSRTLAEKLYPVKIAHVDLSSVPVVAPTVPSLVPTTYSGAGPAITNVTPSTGGVGTTVTVTISGSNFQTGATVKLVRGGSPTIIASAVSVSSSIITGTFNLDKADEGTYIVIVSNPDGRSATLSGGFTIGQAAPVVVGVLPNTGAVGETIGLTITGQNFGDLDTVTFTMGSHTIDPKYVMNTQTSPGPKISCSLKIPDGTPVGDWDVTVLNVAAHKTGTWSQKFHITNATA